MNSEYIHEKHQHLKKGFNSTLPIHIRDETSFQNPIFGYPETAKKRLRASQEGF